MPERKRRYHSPVRERQMAETRQRLIDAGVALVQELPDWDWKNLTFRTVGKRAGISERTVYRHFANERQLRDAVMEQLVSNSGIDIKTLELDNFADITTRTFAYLSSFATQPDLVEDPTLASMDQKRRKALHDAVVRATPTLSPEDHESIAAMLDVLWDLPPYERLIAAWGFSPERASQTIAFMIELVQEAIRQGRIPK